MKRDKEEFKARNREESFIKDKRPDIQLGRHTERSCSKTINAIELPTAPILCTKMPRSRKKHPKRVQKAKGIPPMQKNIQI